MKNISKLSALLCLCVIAICLTFGLGGCSTSGSATREAISVDLGTVAIIPFENLSSEPNAGLIIMRNMNSAFRKYTKLDMIDMDIMRARLEASEGEYIAPRKIGESLEVDTVITGAVTEYRYVYGAGEQPVIGLNVQIISVKTGEVLWSEQASSSGNLSWIREESLAEVAESISISLAKDFDRIYSPVGMTQGYK